MENLVILFIFVSRHIAVPCIACEAAYIRHSRYFISLHWRRLLSETTNTIKSIFSNLVSWWSSTIFISLSTLWARFTVRLSPLLQIYHAHFLVHPSGIATCIAKEAIPSTPSRKSFYTTVLNQPQNYSGRATTYRLSTEIREDQRFKQLLPYSPQTRKFEQCFEWAVMKKNDKESTFILLTVGRISRPDVTHVI